VTGVEAAEGVEAILRAGGLAPPGARTGEPADPVRARRYRHPALGDRPVVRLVADALGPAEDIALAAVGLEPAGESDALAIARRRALGYPGWVLVHHPDEAGRALAAAREMSSLARLARSKPGAAREGYHALAKRLAASVPHHLPTFYEEAARAMIEGGHAGQAGVMFGRAREAERAYGLEVDEDRRVEVFLEFARAGALTAGSLAVHAARLAESRDPAAAHAAFRRLCVERARAGVAPWADMATQLRRLAEAAGVDGEADERDLLAELLGLPAVARAPLGFWKAYRRQLLDLAGRSPAARGALLNLHPTVPDVHEWWLGLLDAAGALDAVTRPAATVGAEAALRGGAAEWLGRTIATAAGRPAAVPDALFALLPRMARRLRADGTPLPLLVNGRWLADLDLLDLALELHLPVQAPEPRTAIHLHRWLLRPAPRRRDLDGVAADAAWGPPLLRALDAHLHRQPAAPLLAGGHLRRGVSAWLDLVADRAGQGGLPDLQEELARLAKVATADVLAVNPAARGRILGADIAGSLARTLRGGCLDELGWPALEEARAGLGARVDATGAWPDLVLSDGVRAVVAGPTGVGFEHDLRRPPGAQPLGLLWAGGQLLVAWSVPGGISGRAYWSGRPDEVFDARSLSLSWWGAPLRLSLPLPDGSRTTGSRAVRPGDTTTAPARHLAADGVRCWALADGRLRELDPATGRTGPESLPEFLAAFDAGGRLLPRSSWLLPLPAGLDGGPLGAGGGLAGFRVRRAGSDAYEIEGTDGRRLVARLPAPPVALVTFPGDAAPRPVTIDRHQLELWDPGGRFRLLRAGVLAPGGDLAPATPVVPPPAYWLALRPRDEAGSAALRAIGDETARSLVDAGDRMEAVGRLLPAIGHPGLRRSVAGQAEVAAALERSLVQLRADTERRERPGPGPSDPSLMTAFGWLPMGVVPAGARPGESSAVAQIAEVERFLETGEQPAPATASSVQWALLAGRMAAAGCRAASPAIEQSEREALLGLLERWAETDFARHPDRYRVFQASEAPESGRTPGAGLVQSGGHRWFVGPRLQDWRGPRRLVLERRHDDGFAVPPDLTVEWYRSGAGGWESPERVRRLVALVRERGPVPWDPGQVDDLAGRTGLSRAESALLLAAWPIADTWRPGGLPTDLRRLLGMTVAEVLAAREVLVRVPAEWRVELVAAAMPDDPADLWAAPAPGDPGGPAARIAATWLRAFGRRTGAGERTVTSARRALALGRPAAEALAGFVDPDADVRLNSDGAWAVRDDAELAELPGGHPAPFTRSVLSDVSLLVPWLFVSAPVGDRARSGIPEVVRRVRLRLANPDLLIQVGWTAASVQGRALLDLVPGPPYRSPRGAEVAGSRDAGAFVLVSAAGGRIVRVHLRPARSAEAGPGLVELLDAHVRDMHRRIRFLAGDEAGALAERVAETPVPAGGWEANPALSAPGVVEAAAARLGLSAEAATLYLQLLAVPEPTVRAVREWNGWTGPRFESAAAELAGSGLALRARRPRAGRDVFLPGGWEELKAPDLPVETWRLRLYGGRPLGRLLALRPLHRLFEDAWRLVEAGRGPAFEEANP
jgi:hypothetical protein